MNLFSFSIGLLALAAPVSAVPAPQATPDFPDIAAAESVIVGNFTFCAPTPDSVSTAGSPQELYFPFDIQARAKCTKDGIPTASASWFHKDTASLDFDLDGVHPATIEINGKFLAIQYNYKKHLIEFQFGDLKWTTHDPSDNPQRGFCMVRNSWNISKLKCPSKDYMFKGGYPPRDCPECKAKVVAAREDPPNGQSLVVARTPKDVLMAPMVHSRQTITPGMHCKPQKACHPSCETDRAALAECNCMYLTCGQGGHDWEQFRNRYDTCCKTAKGAKNCQDMNTAALFDINVNPDGADANYFSKETYPCFWKYQLNMTELYNSGVLNEVKATFDTRAGLHSVSFDMKCRNTIWASVNDKKLEMRYDVDNHWNTFHYNQCNWGQDIYTTHGCGGYCNNRGWYSRGDEKHIDMTCWIYLPLADGQTSTSEVKTIGAREDTQETASAPSDITVTQLPQSLNNIAVALVQDGKTGYYPFTVSITEYCQASEGTPLMARGFWSPVGENGLMIELGSDLQISIPIGWGDLLVGAYDFWTHRLSFHYNGCNWDQDIDGIAQCGYCNSRPWSSGQLNCAMDAGAGRTCFLLADVHVTADERISLFILETPSGLDLCLATLTARLLASLLFPGSSSRRFEFKT
ncbi:hypothetical protein EK21DRAFT_88287 [Setomelanomma holmii]|uniref:Uncharacterized protein n=1 Tax=Setomelanomma holmii TaxID=210430 RepID=A0A9P4HAW6_9PLEO|nr:hypothetical protein EK21DRAFT_88287 [Setomelanomma holmii]